MAKRKNTALKLLADAAFVAGIALTNHCLENKQHTPVKRDLDEKQLNRNLTLMSLLYHAIGIFYNE
jgi:hypothetical protein